MRLLLFFALCAAAAAQDVRLTLATKGGRTQFRMGEQIDVELRFEATAPGKYRVHDGIDRRYFRQREYESYSAEPAAGAVDPLGDSGVLMSGGMGRPPFHSVLGPAPAVVSGIVNDWVSFRQPGRYRIVAESERVFAGMNVQERVALRSNAIEIEIVAAEPEWLARQLADAVAVLESPPSLPSQPGAADAHGSAARALRFLETREAVPHLTRLFDRAPPGVQEELRAALQASPHRGEVIAQMEAVIRAADASVSSYFLGALMQIEYSRRHGPREPMPRHDDKEAMKRWHEADRVYMERFRAIQDRYNAMLAEVLPLKAGSARGAAIETLFAQGSDSMKSQMRKILVSEFASLSPQLQARLLAGWAELGGPDLAPALCEIAAKPGPARDTALEHLLDVDPAGARRLILDRIRTLDIGDPRSTEPRVLAFLPDDRLPDLDDALVAGLDRGSAGPALVARYASEAALPGVAEWLKRNPHSFCTTAVSAYLFRADPARARQHVAAAQKDGPCALHLPQYAARMLMTPELERAFIANLDAADPMTRRVAQTTLQHAGSAAAEAPLWDAFAKLRGAKIGPMEEPLETGFVDALVQGFGWVLNNEKLDAVERACITDRCREFARSQRRALDRPVRITIMPTGAWDVIVGGTMTYTPQQALEKLKQFPRGTEFRLPEGGRIKDGWFWTQRVAAIEKLLTQAGMSAAQ